MGEELSPRPDLLNSYLNCVTSVEPPRSAAVKPKTKNWFGFGSGGTVESKNPPCFAEPCPHSNVDAVKKV